MLKEGFWDSLYKLKNNDAVSWYAKRLDLSLNLINENCSNKSSVIDIGSGRSTLADDLYALGYNKLTLLDISGAALDQTLTRLGKLQVPVSTIRADILKTTLREDLYDLWHDRAVFHFLTEAKQRKAYLKNLKRSLKKGGIVIIATFGPSGPDKCSGLDVVKYDQHSLQKEIGRDFQFLGSKIDYHETPFGTSQQFIYCWFRLLPNIKDDNS